MSANLENLAVATGLEKLSFHSNPKEGQCQRMFKLLCIIVFISHASKVMLKILQARLQQYVSQELPDVQAGFLRGRVTRDQITNIHWIMEEARDFQEKTLTCDLLTMLKPLACGSQQTGKFFKRWESQTTLPVSLETCM